MRMPSNAVRRRLLLGAGALIAGTLLQRRAMSAEPAAARRPLEIGVMPYMPTGTLIAGHEPLRRFIAEAFARPASLSTAADFRTFHRRTLAGDFDLVITGPPLGWHAHLEAGLQLLAVGQRKVQLYILVARDSPTRTLADLRGKTLATIDAMTFTAQTVGTTLRAAGLVPGRDVSIRYDRTPFNTAQAVALGEVAAAGFPNVSFPNLPAEIREQVRIIHMTPGMPGVMFLARPAPGVPTPAEFATALFRFANETEAGRTFLAEFNHDGLIRPDLQSLHVLDSYLPGVRQMIAPR
jgi:ABC-type phosphate/phosphonate transport system substrate-binding protein